jgi:formiminoglutamase
MLYDDHDWVGRYRPASKTPWQGRSDGPGARRFHEVFICDDLRQPLAVSSDAMNFGLLGFASDEGVKRNHGRTGAVKGPDAIRETLAKFPANVPENWKFFDVGDITCDDGDLEAAQQCLAKTVHALLEQGIFPLLIGGGHEISWGHYQGLRQALPETEFSIINFDSHFDMRPLNGKKQGSSGTSFLQIAEDCRSREQPFHYTCFGIQNFGNTSALFNTAKNYGVRYVSAEAYHSGVSQKDHILESVLSEKLGIYATVCLDVFAAPFAPGVSAPQPLGLFPYHVLPQIKTLARSGLTIGFDVAEMNPKYDCDGRTAHLAASLISTFVHEVVSDRYSKGPLSCCE